jgi:hypothetical protein
LTRRLRDVLREADEGTVWSNAEMVALLDGVNPLDRTSPARVAMRRVRRWLSCQSPPASYFARVRGLGWGVAPDRLIDYAILRRMERESHRTQKNIRLGLEDPYYRIDMHALAEGVGCPLDDVPGPVRTRMAEWKSEKHPERTRMFLRQERREVEANLRDSFIP